MTSQTSAVIDWRRRGVPWQAIVKMGGKAVSDHVRLAVDNYVIPIVVKPAFVPRCAPIAEIVAVVALRHGVTVAELIAQDRRQATVVIRNEAFAACADGGFSSLKIGKFFDRDHSTVLHGIGRHRASQTRRRPS